MTHWNSSRDGCRYKDPLERALRISAGLKRKNVRDVALRLRWMATVQASKKRKLAAAGMVADSDAKVRHMSKSHELTCTDLAGMVAEVCYTLNALGSIWGISTSAVDASVHSWSNYRMHNVLPA